MSGDCEPTPGRSGVTGIVWRRPSRVGAGPLVEDRSGHLVVLALRRLAAAVPVLLLTTFVVFLLVAATADPLAALRSRNPPVPEHVLAAREHALDLDSPLLVRYWRWLCRLVSGGFGPSVRSIDIGDDLARRAALTARLVLTALGLTVLIALVVGTASALRQSRWLDHFATVVAFLIISTPAFLLAVLFKEVLGVRLNDLLGGQVVYTVGAGIPNFTGNAPARAADVAGHLLLPALALAAVLAAPWTRFHRAAIAEALSADHVRAARVRGLSQRRVLVRHVLRVASVPLTTVVALDAGAVLGGTVLVERVFGWHGMGDAR